MKIGDTCYVIRSEYSNGIARSQVVGVAASGAISYQYSRGHGKTPRPVYDASLIFATFEEARAYLVRRTERKIANLRSHAARLEQELNELCR